MIKKPEVAIVSAFGRGNWLAGELAEKGFSVILVDVTESLGRWTPEDWEGPFGFLQSGDLTSSQVSRLTEEAHHDPVPDGFTTWINDGPIDMRGLLVQHWLEHMPAMSLAQRYIKNVGTLDKAEIEDLKDELTLAGFSQLWLIHLAHQLASPVFYPSALAMNEGEPLPLFAPLFVRRASRKGLSKSLDWCRAKGVEVLAANQLVDLSTEGKDVASIEITGEMSRAIVAENFVWSLSSLEILKLSEKVSVQLFPRGPLEPEWSWIRFRLSGSFGEFSKTVPPHFLVIGDLGLPWTHANLLAVQRCEVEGSMDVWTRIPVHHRFQRSYIEELGRDICERLAARVPDLNPQIQDWPQDYHYDVAEIGPSLYPIFTPEERSKWVTSRWRNVHFDGPEWLTNLDWTGRFKHQDQILKNLIKWKQIKIAKELKKGERSDQPIHTT